MDDFHVFVSVKGVGLNKSLVSLGSLMIVGARLAREADTAAFQAARIIAFREQAGWISLY